MVALRVAANLAWPVAALPGFSWEGLIRLVWRRYKLALINLGKPKAAPLRQLCKD